MLAVAGLSLADWLARLEQLHPSAIELGLERVRRVREALGLAPAFPCIIVGGTNGKGSTCAYLEAILGAAGYKTGLYTSPHLLRYAAAPEGHRGDPGACRVPEREARDPWAGRTGCR